MDRGTNPFSAPYRFVRGAIDRIPNSRVRSVAAFALMFAASLAIGRAFEIVLSDERVKSAAVIQERWIDALEAFSPLSLVAGYANDIDAVMRGDFVHEAAPETPALTPEQVLAIGRAATREAACGLARARPAEPDCLAQAPAGVSQSTCLVHPQTEGCAALNACLDEEDLFLFRSPPECVGVDTMTTNSLGGSIPLGAPAPAAPIETSPLPGVPAIDGVPIYFAPLAALFRSATRLVNENDVAPFVAIGQIILGGLAFCAVTSAASKGARVGFADFLPNLMIAPVCIVALASVSALAAQWLMIGAVSTFSWATSLAAACCGTTSFGAACWYCLKKLGETGVLHAMTKSR